MFGKNKAKEKESREERFKRIASRRVDEILDKLRILGNCADRSNYSYDEQHITKIFNTINNELKIIKAKFKPSRRSKFILD